MIFLILLLLNEYHIVYDCYSILIYKISYACSSSKNICMVRFQLSYHKKRSSLDSKLHNITHSKMHFNNLLWHHDMRNTLFTNPSNHLPMIFIWWLLLYAILPLTCVKFWYCLISSIILIEDLKVFALFNFRYTTSRFLTIKIWRIAYVGVCGIWSGAI